MVIGRCESEVTEARGGGFPCSQPFNAGISTSQAGGDSGPQSTTSISRCMRQDPAVDLLIPTVLGNTASIISISLAKAGYCATNLPNYLSKSVHSAALHSTSAHAAASSESIASRLKSMTSIASSTLAKSYVGGMMLACSNNDDGGLLHRHTPSLLRIVMGALDLSKDLSESIPNKVFQI